MISIKPLRNEDCEQIVEWNKNKDEGFLFQWAGTSTYKFPLTPDQISSRLDDEKILICKILKDDKMVGTVELRTIENSSVRLCRFLICPQCSGLGYGGAALQRIKEYIFNDLKVKRLDLNVYVYNVAAIRCYEKAGFRVEKFNTSEDTRWNSFTMSVLNQ